MLLPALIGEAMRVVIDYDVIAQFLIINAAKYVYNEAACLRIISFNNGTSAIHVGRPWYAGAAHTISPSVDATLAEIVLRNGRHARAVCHGIQMACRNAKRSVLADFKWRRRARNLINHLPTPKLNALEALLMWNDYALMNAWWREARLFALGE